LPTLPSDTSVSAIATGIEGDIVVDFTCNINSVTLVFVKP